MTDPAPHNPQGGAAGETLPTTPPAQVAAVTTRPLSPVVDPGEPGQQEREITTRWRAGLALLLPARLGRYTLQKLLGQGGMGAVYLAHDAHLDRFVALKIPRFASTAGPEEEERFRREARTAAMLSHPNLCPVYDVGEIEGVAYLTMAYIEGRPLSEILRHDPPWPISDAVRLVARIARAMQEAHRRGIIHRDLKPANVMVDPRGQPVIMDFGLARRGPETGDVRLTRSGVVMGTPAYMPPEQVSGAVHVMGPACDIYSLGVILYELLSGRGPFLGTFGELIAQIVLVPPPPPSRFRPDLDPELDAICLKTLAKNPAERFASMQEFAAALEGCGQRENSALLPPASPAPRQQPAGDSQRLYLAARYYLDKRTEEGNRQAISTYYRLLDKDPSCALAWAGLASAYRLLSGRGHTSPTNTCPKGKSAALRALELDDSLVEAHTALAAILLEYDWDLVGAERVFRRALELQPDHAGTHQLYGKCLACCGRHAEAIAVLRRAQELDPLSATIGVSLGRHGFFLARQYDLAVRQFRNLIDTDPTFWAAHWCLGWTYLCQGNLPAAFTAFETARQLDDNALTLEALGHAHATAGQVEKAREFLDALTRLAKERYIPPDCQASIYIALGDKEQAFAWLERVAEDRSDWLCKMRVDPLFDPVRSDPRFANLLRRVIFPAGPETNSTA